MFRNDKTKGNNAQIIPRITNEEKISSKSSDKQDEPKNDAQLTTNTTELKVNMQGTCVNGKCSRTFSRMSIQGKTQKNISSNEEGADVCGKRRYRLEEDEMGSSTKMDECKKRSKLSPGHNIILNTTIVAKADVHPRETQ